MKDFLSAMATVGVDVGGGWISRYEAGALGQGDVVRSDTDAGMAMRVSLNGHYLCEASLVVVDLRLVAKIERFEPEAPPPALPERGDEATELLPFSIRLASVQSRLGDLGGIGRLSFLDLDAELSETEDAELLVAGVPLAAGKVAVISERFGIRVTRRLAPPFDGGEMRTTGNLLSASYGAEPVKDYDFRRPDKFAYRGVLKAQDLHLEFLRTLQARLPATAKFSIACIDQMTYGEWKASLAAADRAFATFDTAPSRPREEVAIPMPATLVARAEAPKLEMLDPETLEALRGYALSQSRPTGRRPVLASIEGGARALLGEDPGLAVTAACLRNGWKRVADLRMGSASIASAAPGEESIAEGEMILLVSLRHSGGGTLDLVYPALTLEPCFSALNA